MFGAERSGRRRRSLSPSAITRAAPEIVLAPRARWQATYSAAYPLYGDGERTLVVKYPYGRGGSVVVGVGNSAADQRRIEVERGNLEFLFLACLGAGAKDGAGKNGILWDEYIRQWLSTDAGVVELLIRR